MAKVVFRGSRGGARVRILAKEDMNRLLPEGTETNFTKTAFGLGVEQEVPNEVAEVLVDPKTDLLVGKFELVKSDTELEIPEPDTDKKATTRRAS